MAAEFYQAVILNLERNVVYKIYRSLEEIECFDLGYVTETRKWILMLNDNNDTNVITIEAFEQLTPLRHLHKLIESDPA